MMQCIKFLQDSGQQMVTTEVVFVKPKVDIIAMDIILDISKVSLKMKS